MKIKRITASILLTLFIVTAIPKITVFAEEFTDGDYIYRIEDNCAVIIKASGILSGDVIIPNTLGGMPVTKIEYEGFMTNNAFCELKNITSVTLPDTMVSISTYSFWLCSGIEKVIIPSSVTNIEGGAFAGCISLTEFIVSDENPVYQSIDGILYTKDGKEIVAYPGGGINEFTVPESVTSIGELSFCGSLVKNVVIPKNVSNIGRFAFSECPELENVTVYNKSAVIGENAFLTNAFSSENNITIYCPDSSTAQEYAIANETPYVIIEVESNDPYTPGDVTGDGKINLTDVSLILKHIAKWEVTLNTDAADVTVDDKVNLADVSLILKYIAKWDVVLGSSDNSSVNESWKAAYSEYLSQNLSRDSQWFTYQKGEGRFIIEDINADGIPELFIIDINGSTEIITYKNDTLRKFHFTHAKYQTAGIPVHYEDIKYHKDGDYILIGLNRYVPIEDTGVGYVKYVQDCIHLEKDGVHYFNHFDPDFVLEQDWMYWKTYEYTAVTETELHDLFEKYGYLATDHKTLKDSQIYQITPNVIMNILG